MYYLSRVLSEVARLSIDIGGNYQQTIYLYVVQKIDGHDIILGTPWMRHQQVVIEPDRSKSEYSEKWSLTRANDRYTRSETDLRSYLFPALPRNARVSKSSRPVFVTSKGQGPYRSSHQVTNLST
jgi:hypothetical protein